jgi:hypothetical protein
MENKIPMIPIPSTLGGGFAPCYLRQPRAGACTVPRCPSDAVHSCEYKLANGKKCGQRVRDRHSSGGLCPQHSRKKASK